MKGRHQDLRHDEDLKTMYAIFHGKRDIVMFCMGELGQNASTSSRKRPLQDEETVAPKAKTAKKMMEVQSIMKRFKQKHGSKFTLEKYSAWAHMIHMGKHQSFENTPNRAYFGKNPKATHNPLASSEPASAEPASTEPASTEPASTVPASAPLSNIHRRSECIDQLSKCHSLLEKGVISKEQYDILQKRILDDIARM